MFEKIWSHSNACRHSIIPNKYSVTQFTHTPSPITMTSIAKQLECMTKNMNALQIKVAKAEKAADKTVARTKGKGVPSAALIKKCQECKSGSFASSSLESNEAFASCLTNNCKDFPLAVLLKLNKGKSNINDKTRAQLVIMLVY